MLTFDICYGEITLKCKTSFFSVNISLEQEDGVTEPSMGDVSGFHLVQGEFPAVLLSSFERDHRLVFSDWPHSEWCDACPDCQELSNRQDTEHWVTVSNNAWDNGFLGVPALFLPAWRDFRWKTDNAEDIGIRRKDRDALTHSWGLCCRASKYKPGIVNSRHMFVYQMPTSGTIYHSRKC